MFQMQLNGATFDEDNRAVYLKLKSFLIDTAGWAWIEPYDATKDGRNAYLEWSDHYNGPGELSERTALAKSRLASLHYKNERSMTFERYIELLAKCFNTLHKDPDQRLSDRQKVETLLKGITTPDTELQGAKAVIDQSYPRNFTQACSYFSQQVARVHGPAQLEYRQQRGKRRYVSAFQRGGSFQGGRGRGRQGGCFGGRGRGRSSRFGGRYGQSYGQRGRGRGRGRGDGYFGNVVINGIDVSNPFRTFTDEEWDLLGPNGGRAYVTQRRFGQQGRGPGIDDGGRGQAGRGGQRNAAALGASEQTQHHQPQIEQQQEHSTVTGDRGAMNGRGFGRGAYGAIVPFRPGRGPT